MLYNRLFMIKFDFIILLMIVTLVVGCSKQSTAENVQHEYPLSDTTYIYNSDTTNIYNNDIINISNNVNQLSHLTLKDFLNIDSNNEISKIMFFTLDQLFCHHYDGNDVYDDFTNLLRGDTINMARHAYRIFTKPADIYNLTKMMYELPYIGESKYRYPELECTVGLLGRREILFMKKVAPVGPEAVIIISLADNSKLVVWQYRYNVNFNGHMFRFDYHNDPPSDYDILYDDIYNSKPHEYLKYFD